MNHPPKRKEEKRGLEYIVMNSKCIRDLNCRAIAGLARDPLYRNSFFMAFTSIFNAGCGFFFWVIAARLYTMEQVGQATGLISSLGLVTLFSMLGLDTSVIRFFSLGDRGRAISTSLIITATASIIAGVIYILLVKILAPSMLFLREPEYALTFLLIGAINSVVVIAGNALIADRKADHYFLQNLFMALRIPALVALAFLGVFGIFGSVGLGYFAGSCFGLVTLHRNVATIRLLVDQDFIRRSLRFSSWNYVSTILAVAPTMIVPIMVLNMLGEAEAAKYYIAFAIGNMVLIIPSSLGTSLFVEGCHGERLKKSVLRAGGMSFALLMPPVLVLLLFGDQLLGLFGGEYMQAIDLLRIIALSCFPVAVYSLFVPILNVRMRVESVMKLCVLRCVLLLGLNYPLMLRHGIQGVGYAWLITYIVLGLVIVWMARREGWV